MLTKSKILAGLQCEKRLFLQVHRPELEDREAGFVAIQFGNELGEHARRLFPDGRLIEHVYDRHAALRETAECLAREPNRTLFEPAFEAGGLFVRVDVLRPAGSRYDLIEVKASTELKDYHLDDCAVQSWVLDQAGIGLNRILLARVDSSWTYAGDGDYSGLLALEDVTERARARWPSVPGWTRRFTAVLAGAEPAIQTGSHCKTPFACGFRAHCDQALPAYPVHILHRAQEALLGRLRAQGYHDVRDVPPALLGNALHRRIRDASVTGEPFIDQAAARSLARLAFPRYYLDFEAIQFVVPRWAGVRPYRQVPFQFSCHVEPADGRLEHLAFLSRHAGDPRRDFAQALVASVGGTGPILVYNQGYERARVSELAQDFPDLAAPLEALNARIVDLLPLAREGYYHPAMMGSWSIKKVLPTIAPDLDYANLPEVQDGGGAARAFAELLDPATTHARRDWLQQRLLEYCARDTEAMVRLAHFLQGCGAPVAA